MRRSRVRAFIVCGLLVAAALILPVCWPFQGPAAVGVPGGSSVAVQKAALLSAVGAIRRGEASSADVFTAATALEQAAAAEGSTVNGALVGGNWSLVFSEQELQGGDGLNQESLIDQLTAQTYRFFFRFAPALAGAQKGSERRSWWGTPRNEQTVDLDSGSVRNVVEVTPPLGSLLPKGVRLRVIVEGEAVPEAGKDASLLQIVFTRFSAGIVGDAPSWLSSLPAVPLPRPVGRLETVFVDDELRVSRGGRGGLFVLKRRLSPA